MGIVSNREGLAGHVQNLSAQRKNCERGYATNRAVAGTDPSRIKSERRQRDRSHEILQRARPGPGCERASHSAGVEWKQCAEDAGEGR